MKVMYAISAAIAAMVFSFHQADAADVTVQPGVGVTVNAPGVHIDAPAIRPDSWRYRYDNNRWWYYTPENRWMYYNEPGGWVYYEPGYTTYYGGTTVAPSTTYPAPAYSYYPYSSYYAPSLGVYWGYPRYGYYGRGRGWGRRW